MLIWAYEAILKNNSSKRVYVFSLIDSYLFFNKEDRNIKL